MGKLRNDLPINPRKLDKHSRAMIVDQMGHDMGPVDVTDSMNVPTSDYARALAGNYGDRATQSKLPDFSITYGKNSGLSGVRRSK